MNRATSVALKVKNMSQIAEKNAVAEVLTGLIQESANLYCKDLEATPDEVLAASQDGKARSILAFTAETIGFNYMIASVLTGENKPMPTAEERESFSASINSKAAAIGGLQASVGALTAAIEMVDGGDWLTVVMAPWGMEATKANLCGWAAMHTTYHDGQVNLVQVLNGDTDVHWM